MGLEYKKRIKELQGKKAVVAYETLAFGATLAPGAAVAALLADAQGLTAYTTKRPAKLDGITMQLDAALAAGSGDVSVRALVNGLEVGSGLIPAGLSRGDVMFKTKDGIDAEIRMTPEDVLTLDITKGATAAVNQMSVRAALRLFEL